MYTGMPARLLWQNNLDFLFRYRYICSTNLSDVKKGKEFQLEVEITDKNFKEEVLDATKPVLVDFWAPWCMPCRMIAPSVEAIANQYKENLKVCKVNVDECPETATNYQIISIPTLYVFKQGKVVEQIVGALPKEDIENMVKKHL
jgi:thioredoxin 1